MITVHQLNEIRQHCIGLLGLELQVRHNALFAFAGNHVDLDWPCLPESITSPHSLIILLETVRRKKCLMCTMLEIQAESTKDWLALASTLTCPEKNARILFFFLRFVGVTCRLSGSLLG